MIQVTTFGNPLDNLDNDVVLQATAVLFAALNQAEVRYCHWKSNIRLRAALAGNTDLDLLVAPEDGTLFRQILQEYDVKFFEAAPEKAYPSIENYLGMDRVTGEQFHLHVHYQLVLGEQHVKNYRLPLEEYFLNAVQLQHGVKIPTPEMELIILCLRALLKYRDRDVVKDMFSIRSPGLPNVICQEILWLLAQTSVQSVANNMQPLQDIVPTNAILQLLAYVTAEKRDGLELLRLRTSVRQTLKPYRRATQLRASIKYFGQLWRNRKKFQRSQPKCKMHRPSKGLTIALVGADGAGKSTMSRLLHEWLSWKLDVQATYLGSKEPSRRSQLLYIMFRMLRRAHRTGTYVWHESNLISRFLFECSQTLFCLHHLSISYDRYGRYQSSLAQTQKGSIVLFDRFPLTSVLDGPKIEKMVDCASSRLIQKLSQAEQNLYEKFRLPDYLLVLNVSLDVSMARKPDHNREAVAAKVQFINELCQKTKTSPDTQHITCFDAGLPFSDVEMQLKTAVWQRL